MHVVRGVSQRERIKRDERKEILYTLITPSFLSNQLPLASPSPTLRSRSYPPPLVHSKEMKERISELLGRLSLLIH